jgi:phage gp36-like protein
MAAYATINDLVNAATGGWTELAQRAAPEDVLAAELLQAVATGADTSAWTAEAVAVAQAAWARLQDALERASKHADTYLFPRYRVRMPLSTDLVQGSSLPSAVAAIALKRLYGTTVPEDLRRGSAWADQYLVDLSKGTVSLGGDDTDVAQPPGLMMTRAPRREFDWGTY